MVTGPMPRKPKATRPKAKIGAAKANFAGISAIKAGARRASSPVIPGIRKQPCWRGEPAEVHRQIQPELPPAGGYRWQDRGRLRSEDDGPEHGAARELPDRPGRQDRARHRHAQRRHASERDERGGGENLKRPRSMRSRPAVPAPKSS